MHEVSRQRIFGVSQERRVLRQNCNLWSLVFQVATKKGGVGGGQLPGTRGQSGRGRGAEDFL